MGSRDADDLRARALGRMGPRRRVLPDELSREELSELVYELQVHQAELEVQNEDLRRAEGELAAARDRYLDLYEFAPVGYLTLDKQGTVVQANLATTRLCGSDRPEVVGSRFEKLTVREDRDAVYLALREAGDEGSGRSAEFRLARPDEEEVWVLAEVSIGDDARDGSKLYRVTLTDVTKRRRAEHSLRELSESLERKVAARTTELERKSRQLRRLVAELNRAEEAERRRLAELLHDDLQQLLIGVRFRLDVACGREDDARSKELLEASRELVEEGVEKARGLSRALSPPALWHQGVGPAIRELSEYVRGQHGLHVDLRRGELPGSIPEETEHVIYRAVQELLLNVVKHARVSRANVVLKQQEGDLLAVVEDHGVGFDPNQVLADGPTAGLGLARIGERVEACGGRMEVESSPARGTRVTMRVPVSSDSSQSRPAADEKQSLIDRHEDPARLGTEAAGASAPRRIMLVDDHEIVREGLRMLLAQADDVKVVAEASSGEEAVEKVRSDPPDVVLMDVSLPGMSGVEATRLIKSAHPGVHVVGLSMYTEGEAAREMMDAGAAAYVPKVGSTDRLLQAIRGSSGSSDGS